MTGRVHAIRPVAEHGPAEVPAQLASALAVEAAVSAIRRGEMVIVCDGDDRENEGDLIAAAELVTPELVADMVRLTSGVLCVAVDGPRLDELALPPMVLRNEDPRGTAYTVSVDFRHGTTTGISAADRAATIKHLADPRSTAQDFVRPGHVFPLRYQPGGVLCRPGHTEAAVDLARAAGVQPAAVLSEVVGSNGAMARRPELRTLAEKSGLCMISIEDLIQYRWLRETLVEKVATAQMPTEFGTFTAHSYRSLVDGVEHLALVMGEPSGQDVPIRVQSECVTGEVFGSLRCDCGDQLQFAMRRVAELRRGVIVYLRGQEGRGIGLAEKIKAYSLQDRGYDTVEANLHLGHPVDGRTYGIAGQILRDLGVRAGQLMTNNPDKLAGIRAYLPDGLDRIPLVMPRRPENLHYMQTKQLRLGHLTQEEKDIV
ncbi:MULTISPECIES: bifunctional 3,4-dihydroxy-2-butanone-4-phosphate synthase/GTP cyclohydrolase II [Blastococcus]|uniref:Riboflavin biosynthesis protein RibBA n=1 Tax=Blastococcus saxobsidens (strain DD2) TaxID=1146883 RepID=H6RJM9_BLASD|nr:MULTISPECIES: bifunctional 3,4-dihydroxy-2-butanone-4-phosphate synthase/GTP cyclohydrolase II [Blastococcus]TFV92995.1 bifunctional 3,4-dihydroxy-2-butanone-4-phosphate synthase/GTP cyclohydrolase II [Blastococcus sp. CT_GayMR20]CCG02334.1 Riboflavin biosynthesis protein ribBA [Includes: 3,4-dihydroxy-2-butanone 4-phosphate synthase; GTP cyclohydrolase-2] [Blastococcus saxobsidens DD2]